MKITQTSGRDWRLCQQLYYYSYVEGLEPKQEFAPPLQLGRVIHRYLEHFYSALKSKRKVPISAAVRHRNALKLIDNEFREQTRQLAVAAQVAGEEVLGKELLGLVDKAGRLCQAYFELRGSRDTSRVLLCEEYLSFPLTATDETVAIVDLVTQDADGKVWIWEHKTTGNVPGQGRRLRDLQTILGAALLEETKGLTPSGVVWNYFRTKEPAEVRLLQNGTLSRAKTMDTTWRAYEKAIKENSLDAADYTDMEAALVDREVEVFYPRIEMQLLQSEGVLLRDLILTCEEIKRATGDPAFIPVRSIGINCDWCRYTKLCEAVLLGGGDEELKPMLFKVKGARRGYSAEHS